MFVAVNKYKKVPFALCIAQKQVFANNAFIKNAKRVHFIHGKNRRMLNMLIFYSERIKALKNRRAFIKGNAAFCRSCNKNIFIFIRKSAFCFYCRFNIVKYSENGSTASRHKRAGRSGVKQLFFNFEHAGRNSDFKGVIKCFAYA